MTPDKLKQALVAFLLILERYPYPAGFAFKPELSSDGLGLVVRNLHTGEWVELRRTDV